MSSQLRQTAKSAADTALRVPNIQSEKEAIRILAAAVHALAKCVEHIAGKMEAEEAERRNPIPPEFRGKAEIPPEFL